MLPLSSLILISMLIILTKNGGSMTRTNLEPETSKFRTSPHSGVKFKPQHLFPICPDSPECPSPIVPSIVSARGIVISSNLNPNSNIIPRTRSYENNAKNSIKSEFEMIDFKTPENIEAIGNQDVEKCATGSGQKAFIRIEGVVSNQPTKVTLEDIGLAECSRSCAENNDRNFECGSFEFDSGHRTCFLKRGNAGDKKNGEMVSAPIGSDLAHFRLICLEVERLCPSPYIFEQISPNFSTSIEWKDKEHPSKLESNSSSFSDCLTKCLKSTEPCRFVAWSPHSEGECRLSNDYAAEENVFDGSVNDYIGDRFENACADVECPTGSELHWIRSEISVSELDGRSISISKVTLDECRELCTENRVRTGDAFPCRSFVYHTSKEGECELRTSSSLRETYSKWPYKSVKKRNSGVLSQSYSVERFPAEENEFDASQRKGLLRGELKSLTVKQRFDKICISNKFKKCQDFASFARVYDKELLMNYCSKKMISTPNLENCLSECFSAFANCDFVAFNKRKNECLLYTNCRDGDNQSANLTAYYYFENLCENSSSIPRIYSAASLLSSNETEKIRPQLPRLEMISQDTTTVPSFGKGPLEMTCRPDGIIVKATFSESSTGSIFLRDYHDTCSIRFVDKKEAALHIPFPPSLSCPITQISPVKWSFIIVLQLNKLNMPGLLTASDRFFTLICDYGGIKLTRGSKTFTKEIPELLVVRNSSIRKEENEEKEKNDEELPGKWEPIMQLSMGIFYNGHQTNTVILGEEYEIRWMSLNEKVWKRTNEFDERVDPGTLGSNDYGFFIENCTAERIELPNERKTILDRESISSPILRLIINGCQVSDLIRAPIKKIVNNSLNTYFRAFRFDGSQRVRIRCSANICWEKCHPVECWSPVEAGESNVSYGRKKRRVDQSVMTISGSYTIIDPTPGAESMYIINQTHQRLKEVQHDKEKINISQSGADTEGNCCASRKFLLLLFVSLAFFAAVQLMWIILRTIRQQEDQGESRDPSVEHDKESVADYKMQKGSIHDSKSKIFDNTELRNSCRPELNSMRSSFSSGQSISSNKSI